MSLDAAVFRSQNTLRKLVSLDEVKEIDPQTGEYAYVDEARPSPPQVFVACDRELANMSEAAELREVFAHWLPLDSVLLSRVICDGSHSGDILTQAEVAQLHKELKKVAMRENAFAEEFVRKLQELIAALEGEGNPIVFM